MPRCGWDFGNPTYCTLVEAAAGRHGVGQARTAAALIDVGSESPGESFSRVRFWRWRLPTPTLQYVVRDLHGAFVARGDFGWPELGTIGEFDGKSKYGPELLKPGQTVREAVLAEKRREERMRELGWQVVALVLGRAVEAGGARRPARGRVPPRPRPVGLTRAAPPRPALSEPCSLYASLHPLHREQRRAKGARIRKGGQCVRAYE